MSEQTQRQSWRDIRDHIHGQILDLTYRPGDKLPRDEDIARTLECARSTVHRAMRSLAEDGLIERRRKGGTTVRRDPVARTTLDIPIARAEVEARGQTYHHHLIGAEKEVAPPSVAARFGPDMAGSLLRIRALHLANGRPFMLEDRWVSLVTVPEMLSVNLGRISANEWLVHNRPFDRCDVQIFADRITDSEAQVMEVQAGGALLVLERMTFIDGAPITFVRVLHAPEYRLTSRG